MGRLEDLGWDASWAAAFEPHVGEALVPARVAVAHRGAYVVRSAGGESLVRLAGRVHHEGGGAAVGDWVALHLPRQGDARIDFVLPRRTALVRQAAGTSGRPQVLAANVDLVMVVAGLDGDFNPRRVERALVAVAESGARAVILLNKADACDAVADRVREMDAAAAGVPVHVISALTGEGVEPVAALVAVGTTVVLLGSSGAGKSTLANRLLGEALLETGPVREYDSRGRHTTTRRELFVLPGGGVLIDTPGLRELQLWAGPEAAAEAFLDLDAIAKGCRFTDCRHQSEPGCAVLRATEEGTLDPLRLASYHKLQAELRFQELRTDPLAANEQKRRWRAVHKAAKKHRNR